MAAAKALTYHKSTSLYETRGLLNTSLEGQVHNLVKLPNSRKFYYCHHWYGSRRSANLSTTFKCEFCDVPMYKPTKTKSGCIYKLIQLHCCSDSLEISLFADNCRGQNKNCSIV